MSRYREWDEAREAAHGGSGPKCPECNATFTDESQRLVRLWVGYKWAKIPTPIKSKIQQIQCHICGAVTFP